MKRIGLGKKESCLLTTLMGNNESVFTTEKASLLLGSNLNATRKLLSDLVRKGWLIRLKSSLFLIVPLEAGPESHYSEHELVIASHLAKPYYIGFWSALNFHGLTEQTPYTVFVATPNKKRSRKILGVEYLFIGVKKENMFGFKEYPIANRKVFVSDKEKTMVDCLARPDLCGGLTEPLKPLLAGEKLDYGRLISYALKIGGAALKRTGFLVEKLNLCDVKSLLNKVHTGYVYLDSAGPKEGRHNSRWNIIENISLEKAARELGT